MPKYELMYILASSVGDDQVPVITEQVKKYVADFGGTQIKEDQLGKKKLAYPIKRTRNGHYVVVSFDMDTKQINDLDAKIRSQANSIIRYLLVNKDEHLARLEKDVVAQSKLSHQPETQENDTPASPYAEPKVRFTEPVAEKPSQPVIEINAEELDKKIEEALTEDLLK